MEILLIALVLTILLAVVPVRGRARPIVATPAAICRYVNLDELRGRSGSPDDVGALHRCARGHSSSRGSSSRTAVVQPLSTLEQDHVEIVEYQGTRLIALMDGDLLLLKSSDDQSQG